MILYLEKTNKYLFFLIAIITVIYLNFLGANIIEYYFGEDTMTIDYFKDKSFLFIFIVAVLIGPLFETIIFQFGIIEIVLLIEKSLIFEFIAILLSSTLFGLSHNYNTYYMVFAIIMGVIFGIIYVIAKRRKDTSPFFIVYIVHFFSNLISSLYNYVFEIS
jgi:membrane protease YdiL (CAAX protease family)